MDRKFQCHFEVSSNTLSGEANPKVPYEDSSWQHTVMTRNTNGRRDARTDTCLHVPGPRYASVVKSRVDV